MIYFPQSQSQQMLSRSCGVCKHTWHIVHMWSLFHSPVTIEGDTSDSATIATQTMETFLMSTPISEIIIASTKLAQWHMTVQRYVGSSGPKVNLSSVESAPGHSGNNYHCYSIPMYFFYLFSIYRSCNGKKPNNVESFYK